MKADTQTGLRNQVIAGAALSLIGLGAIGLSLQYPLGDANEPGPAYYPLILSVLLAVFGAMVIWKGDDTRLQLAEWWENGRPLAILVALCIATLLLEPLGFRLTTAAMLVALLGILERRDWRMVLLIAVAFPIATYALLHNALKINLPLGPFGIVAAMGTIENLLSGFAFALQPSVLAYCLAGCVIGTIVGMLPGLGPLAAISLLLPATFGLNPAISLMVLAGVYYGAMYGGSTTSILMRIPGETASVVTCIDGYEMTKRGRSGAALFIAAVGSFVAGTFSVLLLMMVAPPLAKAALLFGPPEMTALLTIGILALATMSQGSAWATLALATLGLLLGTIGIDTMTGYTRFTFGVTEFGDGIGLIPVAVGLFGVSEIMLSAASATSIRIEIPKLRELIPTRAEFSRSIGPIGRGSALGFGIGLLPGAAHIIASFMSYALERKLSRHPEEFGHGAIEGVAGPESANNAAASAAFVPMLSLGIPAGPVAAVMLAAIMFHGISPGPNFIVEHPTIFWSFVASMYIGNVALLLLNLPMVGLFVNLLRIPYTYLYPVLLCFCIISVYSLNLSVTDVWIMIAFGAIGFAMRRLGLDPAPVVMGLVLSPIFELSLRQTLAMSGGDYSIFLKRPITVTLLAIVFIALVSMVVGSLRKRRATWRDQVGLNTPAN